MNKKLSIILSVLAALILAGPAVADVLADYKAAGQIGERVDGYVGAVSNNATVNVKAVVDQVNAERRARYTAIAQQNGTPVDYVAQRAGQLLVKRTPAGQQVMGPSGAWQTR